MEINIFSFESKLLLVLYFANNKNDRNLRSEIEKSSFCRFNDEYAINIITTSTYNTKSACSVNPKVLSAVVVMGLYS